MVESGELEKPERLELEQAAAMAVSSWRLLGGEDPGPAIARIEVPDAPPNRRRRRAVSFDGDVAFAAFVEPDMAKKEFEAVGRQQLKHRDRSHRNQGGA
jgi:hypothetical protein